jgi:hypothetical protein
LSAISTLIRAQAKRRADDFHLEGGFQGDLVLLEESAVVVDDEKALARHASS